MNDRKFIASTTQATKKISANVKCYSSYLPPAPERFMQRYIGKQLDGGIAINAMLYRESEYIPTEKIFWLLANEQTCRRREQREDWQ